MNIDKAILSQAVLALSSLDRVQMGTKELAQDATRLTFAFPEQNDYKLVVCNTAKAMKDLVRGRVSSSTLDGVFQGWESYHYQPKVGQGIAADMRIVFKREAEGIRILGFGHRYIPDDLYKRLNALQRK